MGRARCMHKKNYKCILSIDRKTEGRAQLENKDVDGGIIINR
jgi:hypothetical protein